MHEALDTLEKEAARGFTVYPLLDLCFGYLKQDRFEEARWFGEEGLSRVAVAGRPRGREEPPLPPRRGVPPLGRRPRLARSTSTASRSLYPDFKNLRAYLDVFDFRNVINLRS